MENKNDFQEARFVSYLNKIIIFASKGYFKKQMSIINKERTVVNDDYDEVALKFALKDTLFDLEKNEDILDLNKAIESLSAIEQSVIFLLFHEDLTQDEAANILEVYSKTISKIKIRAINKLKKELKGENTNEE